MRKNNVLLIGGKGKTGRHIAKKLADRNIEHRIATRTPENEMELAFDWLAPNPAYSPFKDVQSLFIIAPTNNSNHGEIVPPVLEQARNAGVRRFVLLSASSLEPGGLMMGQVHSWLMENTDDWAVLRPSWFMQNFSEQQHLPTIKNESAIYSATGSGKVGFIDTRDIAEVAVAALTSPTPWNKDYILTGPNSIDYSEIASTLGASLGRIIRHENLTAEQLAERFQQQGMDQTYSRILASLDTAVAGGSEDTVNDNVLKLTGGQATGFKDFVLRELDCWT